jgi:hypothetical protein
MSIFSLSTAQAPQTLAASATSTPPASPVRRPFSAQLQSLRAGQSSAGSSSTTQTAFHTEQRRGAPSKAHHPHGRNASSTDSNAATGTANGPTTAAGQSGTKGPGSTGQQTKGGVLLNDMMRGLQAYGVTTTLA